MQRFTFTPGGPRTAAIVSKPGKLELATIVPELVGWCRAHNYRVVADRETAAYCLGLEATLRDDLPALEPDFVVVLGGDGTLLSAARAVAKAGIPVLGVNLGSLGFLTEVPLSELYPTLEEVDSENCFLEPRSMLHCEVHRAGSMSTEYHALNDVVISKSAIARLNQFELFVDQAFVSIYKADGLIVSTPTGSTAYSMAAGGPILTPSVAGFVITPVSPHSLTHRALVVRDSAEVMIKVSTGEEEAYLSVDGQIGMPLHDGDAVVCRCSEYTVQLLRVKKTFFDVLRTKLKWGQR
jgi:NAD+ kinase